MGLGMHGLTWLEPASEITLKGKPPAMSLQRSLFSYFLVAAAEGRQYSLASCFCWWCVVGMMQVAGCISALQRKQLLTAHGWGPA